MRKTKTNKASNKWANYIKRIVYLGRVICYILLLFFSANVNSFSPESVADSKKKLDENNRSDYSILYFCIFEMLKKCLKLLLGS